MPTLNRRVVMQQLGGIIAGSMSLGIAVQKTKDRHLGHELRSAKLALVTRMPRALS